MIPYTQSGVFGRGVGGRVAAAAWVPMLAPAFVLVPALPLAPVPGLWPALPRLSLSPHRSNCLVTALSGAFWGCSDGVSLSLHCGSIAGPMRFTSASEARLDSAEAIA